MNNIDFARNLVKGRIAETIFAQMLRESDNFTVLEFGYEKVVPELVQHGYDKNDAIIETLRTAPDFAVIDQASKKVHLVEVKYHHHLSEYYAYQAAKRMAKSWNPSYLFIASQDGFYFDFIDKILDREGAITPLAHDYIAEDIQDKYLQILIDFETNN